MLPSAGIKAAIHFRLRNTNLLYSYQSSVEFQSPKMWFGEVINEIVVLPDLGVSDVQVVALLCEEKGTTHRLQIHSSQLFKTTHTPLILYLENKNDAD